MQFAASHCFGESGRAILPALAEHQADPVATAITPRLVLALQLLVLLLRWLPPRRIPVSIAYEAPTIIYTDAMYEPPLPFGVAYVVFSHRRRHPQAGWAHLPDAMVAHWVPKRQQICQGELMAALLALYNEPSLLKDADIIHFIDNRAALSGVIRGCSSKSDSAAIASVYHLLLARIGARCWAEHVDSDSNPIDAMSRVGPAGALPGWEVHPATVPEWGPASTMSLITLLWMFVPEESQIDFLAHLPHEARVLLV